MNTLSHVALITTIALGTQSAFAAVSPAQANGLKAGLSEQQVVSTLGAPDSVTHWPNGTHSLSYALKDDAQHVFYVDISDASGKVISEEATPRD